MIELIFAIVVVAIVMLTIPMIIRVMNQSEELSLGQEIFAKMYAQAQRKSMNPWDENVTNLLFNFPADGTVLMINATDDLNCSRQIGTNLYRENNISTRECNQALLTPSAIINGDKNGTLGIEHYNNTTYTVKDTLNGDYQVHIVVAYVDDGDKDIVHNGNYTTTWEIGNDTSPSGATAAANATHLKRVVMRFTRLDGSSNPVPSIPVTTLTFYMSNIGVVQ